MSVGDRIEALRADRARGSSALADEALAILAEAAREAPEEGGLERLDRVAEALVRARPAMVALENRVHKVMAALHAAEAPPSSLRDIAAGLCEEVRLQAAREREEAARVAAGTLRGPRVLTVSWSDTTAKALEGAAARTRLEVVVPQGFPLLDGQRAAQRLALAGLAVELVPDAALGYAALACDEALVGADAILRDGTVVNRAGTSLAALAMAIGGRPLWVVAESAKVTWRDAVPLEEAPARDVWDPGPLLPVKVRHPLFRRDPREPRARLLHGGGRAARAGPPRHRRAPRGPRGVAAGRRTRLPAPVTLSAGFPSGCAARVRPSCR